MTRELLNNKKFAMIQELLIIKEVVKIREILLIYKNISNYSSKVNLM